MPFSMKHITVGQVLAAVDIQQAIRVFHETFVAAPVNSLTPWPHGNPPVGTWRLDPVFGEFEVLVDIPSEEIREGEPEDMIKRHPTYPLYVEWAKAGLEAPAVTVVRHIQGHLVCSSGRRRRLAALEAGLPLLRAWFSETDERGWNLWRKPELGTVWEARRILLENTSPDLQQEKGAGQYRMKGALMKCSSNPHQKPVVAEGKKAERALPPPLEEPTFEGLFREDLENAQAKKPLRLCKRPAQPPLYQQLMSRARKIEDFACLLADLGAPEWRVEVELELARRCWELALVNKTERNDV